MSELLQDIGGNAIIYSYPSGDYDIVCAASKWYAPEGWEENKPDKACAPAPRQKGKRSEGEDMLRSMRRARANLRRLALANAFGYFVTLTLDPAKIDRYDGAAVTKALSHWCDNMVRRHGLKYILVPERHKDGAFHFHGFAAGGGLNLVDSGTLKRPGHKKPQRPKDDAERAAWLAEGAQVVYNLPQWTLGFTTALPLYGEYAAAVGYVCKYIGKQEGQRPLGRWYYSGGGLAKPAKEYATMDYRALAADYAAEAVELNIPGTQLLVVHHRENNKI